jgi:hypothetical protein
MNRDRLLLISILALLPFVGAACGVFQSPAPDGGIYVTADRGETFSQLNFVSQQGGELVTLDQTNVGGIVFHPVQRNIMYAMTIGDGIYKTTTEGAQWFRTGLTGGTYGRLIIDPITPSTLYASNGRHILKSGNAGETWKEIFIETRGDQSITDMAIDPQMSARLLAVTDKGDILVSEDFGGTWDVLQHISRGIAAMHIHPSNSLRFFFRTVDQHLLRTDDGGTTFDDLTENWSAVTLRAGTLYDLAFRRSAPDVLFLATSYGLMESVDAGETWVLQPTLIQPSTVPISAVLLPDADPLTIYLLAGRTLHRSLDGGVEWAVRSIPTSRAITTVVAHPNDPRKLFFGTRFVEQ